MRAADRDQVLQRAPDARGELQADHRAVGAADEGVAACRCRARRAPRRCASAWSAVSIGASSAPSAPSQSKRQHATRRESSARPRLRLAPAAFGERLRWRRRGGARRCRRATSTTGSVRGADAFVAQAHRDACRHGAGRDQQRRFRRAAHRAARSETARVVTAGRTGGVLTACESRRRGSWRRSWRMERPSSVAGVAMRIDDRARGAGVEPSSGGPRVPAGFGTNDHRLRMSRLPRRLRACPSAGLDGWPQAARRFRGLSIASCG